MDFSSHTFLTQLTALDKKVDEATERAERYKILYINMKQNCHAANQALENQRNLNNDLKNHTLALKKIISKKNAGQLIHFVIKNFFSYGSSA